jgi:hypothetical protein
MRWFLDKSRKLWPLEAHPERAFWEIRASKTKGLWFKKRPKTLFPDASLGEVVRSGTFSKWQYGVKSFS